MLRTRFDLVLSSGFLAFARHVGVLQAVEAHGVAVDAVVGTSSGALVGSLWCAGVDAQRLEGLVHARRPFDLMGFHPWIWKGAFSLHPLVSWLREHLPPTFEDLPRPFAVGVVSPEGPRLIRSGPLPEAVAASCAIPGFFVPIHLDGVRCQDGGVADRVMLGPWREWRGERPVLVHMVDRMAGKDPADPMDGIPVIRTPRSGASFWSLGDVPAAVALARERAEAVLADLAGR